MSGITETELMRAYAGPVTALELAEDPEVRRAIARQQARHRALPEFNDKGLALLGEWLREMNQKKGTK